MMDTGPMATALRNIAARVRQVDAEDCAVLRDASGLLRVMAHMLEGKPTLKAFGAPGDWGYETEVGKALIVMLATSTKGDDRTALQACLDVLLRMIPDYCQANGAEPCLDTEHDAAIVQAAIALHGPDRNTWPQGLEAVEKGEYA